ncbi:hypothetical protein BD410DRAFT_846728 [Rickenella mellea]|uniref:Uncharacterized protein n=1 Tax=Rickenella mellea TaxID=50990 RepID=A0A4Y7PH05_9AGAM|nr:hypothetical protein BD410DRAFT_846728 [Rickenella mellea]
MSDVRSNAVAGPSQSYELQDIPPRANEFAFTNRWHPKLTLFRLLVITHTAGFGLAKAILTYLGQSIGPTTLEWVFAVVICLFLYFLGLFETHAPLSAPWLFEKDCMFVCWQLLHAFKWSTPTYRSDERSIGMLIKPPHPSITGYRILLVLITTTFGSIKAVLSYQGHTTSPTTLDWAFGVVIIIGLYWLGLYQMSTVQVLPALFDTDYTPVIQRFLLLSFAGGFQLGYVLIHIVGMALATGWGYIWLHGLIDLWSAKTSGEGKDESSSPPTVPPSKYDVIAEWFFKFMWSTGACAAIGAAVVGVVFLLVHLFVVLQPALSAIVRYVRRWRGEDERDPDEERGLLAWAQDAIPRQPISLMKYHPVLQYVRIGLLAIGYIVGHAVVFLFTMGWTLLWFTGLRGLWSGTVTSSDDSIFYKAFIWSFTLIWSTWACAAMGMGSAGCLAVLASLIAPITGFGRIYR